MRKSTGAVLASLILLCGLVAGCEQKPKPKVFVLGMDGITFELLTPWIGEGKLPNFEQMVKDGSSTQLISTMPPASPLAWTSAVTGVNPGKHGIFGFTKSLSPDAQGQAQRSFYTARDRRADPLWVILSQRGKRSIVVNVPVTSPPDKLKGLMISGFPYVSMTNFTYPPELRLKIPDYRKDVYGPLDPMDGEEKYIANLTDIETRRAEQVFKFLAEEEWDLFFVVFTITDRAQHYFWKYMDPDHPYYDPEKARRYADAILKVYQQMDDFLGRLRATLDDQTTLMIMSDHGFGPIYQMINGQNFIDRTLPPGEIWAMTTDNYGARYHLAAATAPPYDQRIQQAYANAKDVLRKRLDELEDPDAGQRVIQKIFERDDLYWGPYAKEAPDILGLEYKGYKFLNGFPTPEGEIFIPKGYPAYDHLFSATHELNGVLIMAGNSVSQGVNNFDAHIMDIAPTVLYLLSEPIPEDMDGRALTAPLSGEYVRHHPLQTSHPSSGREHRLRDLADSTKAIDRLVEEQLKAIGYVH